MSECCKSSGFRGENQIYSRDSIYENHPLTGRFKTKEEISVIGMSPIQSEDLNMLIGKPSSTKGVTQGCINQER